MTMATVPIFVLGLQRSGTTWVANMLAGSGRVSAVEAEDHRGVHESIFFSHFAVAFGPFDDPTARVRFVEAFAASDYFLLSGLSPDDLAGMVGRARSHAEVFAGVMDAMAARAGNRFWVEKSPDHTLLATALAATFPAARFVCVVRDSRSLVTSRLAAYGRTPARGLKRKRDLLRGAAVNQLHARHLARFCRTCDRALLVSYGDLLRDPAGTRARIAAFLGSGLAPEALESRYAPNTSHAGTATRRLSGLDVACIAMGDAIARLVPLGALAAVHARIGRRRGVAWPDWCWKRSGYVPDAGYPKRKSLAVRWPSATDSSVSVSSAESRSTVSSPTCRASGTRSEGAS
jgi:hypothetical protein